MPENPGRMWAYWRDKHGIKDALEYQFPETLAKEPLLQVALAQIKLAEFAIDSFMSASPDTEED